MQRPSLVVMAFALAIIGCAHSSAKPDAPRADEPVSGPILLTVNARGVQIYTWKLDDTGKGSWAFKAPEATFSALGVTGKHYAGPTWETADGTKVVARKLSEKSSPDPTAVPWLVLEATSHEGTGILSKTTFIRRTDTAGGKPPTRPGNAPGEELRVEYTAKYIFYGPGAATRP